MNANTILVLGGTGKTGRRIAEQLKARGRTVRIGSRSSHPSFDWENPATWAGALQGVSAAYISYFPDLAAPSAPAAIEQFSQLAVRMGVKHLVLLSGRGEVEAQRCEQIVQQSGAAWTIVRASWFNQNFSENYWLDPILSGDVALPAGKVGAPFVDADDIADVAVAALTDERHQGQIYEVTGPQVWTFAEAVAEIAKATGRDIRFTQISVDEYIEVMKAAQLPPDVIALVAYLFSEVLVESNTSISDGVMRALGRPAKDFKDYVRETAATGVWNAPEGNR
jgi:uncharacterized protein YbjT (DUF2867 family)